MSYPYSAIRSSFVFGACSSSSNLSWTQRDASCLLRNAFNGEGLKAGKNKLRNAWDNCGGDNVLQDMNSKQRVETSHAADTLGHTYLYNKISWKQDSEYDISAESSSPGALLTNRKWVEVRSFADNFNDVKNRLDKVLEADVHQRHLAAVVTRKTFRKFSRTPRSFKTAELESSLHCQVKKLGDILPWKVETAWLNWDYCRMSVGHGKLLLNTIRTWILDGFTWRGQSQRTVFVLNERFTQPQRLRKRFSWRGWSSSWCVLICIFAH